MVQLIDRPTVLFSFCKFTYEPAHKHNKRYCTL